VSVSVYIGITKLSKTINRFHFWAILTLSSLRIVSDLNINNFPALQLGALGI